jgi:hypothetical protein
MAKLSPVLENHLETAKPDDWVDVVLEVNDQRPPALPSERNERYAAVDQHFTSLNQNVIQCIHDAGGQVVSKSWLSGAIKARVRANDIGRLLSLDNVALIDLPRRLTRS